MTSTPVSSKCFTLCVASAARPASTYAGGHLFRQRNTTLSIQTDPPLSDAVVLTGQDGIPLLQDATYA
jgi:hypothetical protein